MWLSTHYSSGFLQDWFHVFLYEIKKNSVWYNFYQGTSVSITFYIFEHYQLWMMDSKGQRVFFPKTPQLCVWHTEVRRCYHFKLVSHFQLWFPIWGVLVNRLMPKHTLYTLTKIQKVKKHNRTPLTQTVAVCQSYKAVNGTHGFESQKNIHRQNQIKPWYIEA